MDADGRGFGFNHLFSLMGTDISELRKNFDDRRCDQKALQQRFSDRNDGLQLFSATNSHPPALRSSRSEVGGQSVVRNQ
jgi:hypothetical protein